MRIIVFSDIHGNPYACRAVLDAIAYHGELDAIVIAGDLCLGGSDPAACIAMLLAAGVSGVYGNTDQYILHPEEPPKDDHHIKQWNTLYPVVRWARAQLSDHQFAWLQSLPFELRYSPDRNTAHDLLVVHANPKDVDLMIYPPVGEQQNLWGLVRQADDDPELSGVMEGVVASVVAFGHFHTTFQRRWQNLKLVDVACCSLPGVDHDPRARYTLFEWQREGWKIEHHWVDYDYRQELQALKNSAMPNKEFFFKYFA